MAIENRNLEVGTRLVAKYKQSLFRAQMVRGELKDGIFLKGTEDSESSILGVRLEDGRGFKSLSAAGSAVMAGMACNGWRFWSIAKDEAETPTGEAQTEPAEEPKAEQVEEAKPKAKGKGKKARESQGGALETPSIDCTCLTHQPGIDACRFQESGDCSPA